MTIVYTGRNYEGAGKQEILCSRCRKVVAIETYADANLMSLRDDIILCFECEGGGVENLIPSQLLPGSDEVVVLKNVDTGLPQSVILWPDNWHTPRCFSVYSLPKTCRGDACLVLHNVQNGTKNGEELGNAEKC